VEPVSRRRGVITVAGLAVLCSLAAVAACGAGKPNPSATPSAAPSATASSFYPGQGLNSPAQEKSGIGSGSGVSGGVLFGGTSNLLAVQPKLGRKIAIMRSYYRLGETFPTQKDQQTMAAGTTLLVSLDTVPGNSSYAAIAAGQRDQPIRAFLEAMNQAAIRYHLGAIYFCFEHEADAPGTHHGLGTPAQFVQAWDHIHQLAVSAHLNWQQGGRLHWVLILLHLGYTPLNDRPQWAQKELSPNQFWPGTKETDMIGVDGYNTAGCGTKVGKAPTTPAKVFGPAVDFAHSVGLPVFIAEWGTTPGGNQPVFIAEMQKFVQTNREIAAVSYWDSPGTHCSYVVNNNDAALRAMNDMARSATFQGHPAS
jgi:hypothetical protein